MVKRVEKSMSIVNMSRIIVTDMRRDVPYTEMRSSEGEMSDGRRSFKA